MEVYRQTVEVESELRIRMNDIVKSYPPHIHRVPEPPIAGTAFFPGGSGLWCGLQPFAPPPELFPIAPIMFVAHNYAGFEAFLRLRERGGEAVGDIWWPQIVLPLILGAGIEPEGAFFTNALMGLKDGGSEGDMGATPEFENECSAFLREQIRIVRPSRIVSLGGDSYPRVRAITHEFARCIHPSAWEFRPRATRAERVAKRADELRLALEALAVRTSALQA